MKNGWISKYEIYLTDDPADWGQPVAKGALKPDKTAKTIPFKTPVKARFLRFVAADGINNQIFASIAELDIIPAQSQLAHAALVVGQL